MINSIEVVKSARKLIGTPYLHQGRLPGKACDCLGVPILVGAELGLFDHLSFEQKELINRADYRRIPDGTMGKKIDLICQKRFLQQGVLLLFKISTVEQHCGIVSNYMNGYGLIHAWDVKGVNKVCEHRLSKDWLQKVLGCYGLPGVKYE